ncbi:MAG: hypothetical protein C5B51_08565 [Terriglobia bacterium]|nr:MAG: hypothetical protein C5B51_08565 [Terriglobia bacterium]
MKRVFGSLALTWVLLVARRPAGAHHGWAEFDETAEISVDATVSAFHFVNPHCVVEFDLKDDSGKVRRWQGEFSNPGQLARKGWNAASLQPGDRIKLSGHPARNNVPAIHVTKIRTPDGKEVGIENER